MKIAFLDVKTLGYEMDVSGLFDYGDVSIYDNALDNEASELIADADIIITNQNNLNESNLKNARNLKMICAAATGYNNIDTSYCRQRNIAVTNVPGYATNSVAQHTFSMLFYLISHARYYDDYIKNGEYSKGTLTIHRGRDFMELEGKTWGIVGLGEIGKKVAAYASGFGCKVVYYSTSGKNVDDNYKSVDFDELLRNSDIISIHAPLNSNTRGLFGIEQIMKMKKTAFLLNLGRGGIVVESDLAKAIDEDLIGGAGLDVFENEPLLKESLLLKLKKKDKLIMTPHIAYASIEARNRLMEMVCRNIEAFLAGEKLNRVE